MWMINFRKEADPVLPGINVTRISEYSWSISLRIEKRNYQFRYRYKKPFPELNFWKRMIWSKQVC